MVARWPGRETWALRGALRLDLTGFAQVLNLATATVLAWESPPSRLPRLTDQTALDRVLARATPDARARFQLLLHGEQRQSVGT